MFTVYLNGFEKGRYTSYDLADRAAYDIAERAVTGTRRIVRRTGPNTIEVQDALRTHHTIEIKNA